MELEFRRIWDQAGYAQRGVDFDLVIADKKTNSEGLQVGSGAVGIALITRANLQNADPRKQKGPRDVSEAQRRWRSRNPFASDNIRLLLT